MSWYRQGEIRSPIRKSRKQSLLQSAGLAISGLYGLLFLPASAMADLEGIATVRGGGIDILRIHDDGNVTYAADPFGGDSVQLLRTGYGTIFSKEFSSSPALSSYATNYAGDVAYSLDQGGSYTIVGELVGTVPYELRLFDFSSGVTTTVAVEGQNGVPSGGTSPLNNLPLSGRIGVFGVTANQKITFSAGESAVYESATNNVTSTTGIYSVGNQGGPVTKLVEVGAGQLLTGIGSSSYRQMPNTNGDVSFTSMTVSVDGDDNLVYSSPALQRTNGGGSPVSLLTGSSSPAPDGNGQLDYPFAPETGRITDSGEWLGFTKVSNTAGGSSDDSGLFLMGAGGVTQLVREGDQIYRKDAVGNIVPDGFMGSVDGQFSNSYFTPDNSVIFSSTVTGTAGLDQRLFKYGNGQLTELARTGQSIPGGELITGLGALNNVVSESNRFVLFRASYATPGPAGYANALLMTDGVDTVEVARASSFYGYDLANFNTSYLSVNLQGEVALTDGGTLYRYSPDLSWKPGVSGAWEDANTWTFGFTPGARNTVSIDDAAGVTVTGPVADTEVRAVRVGEGGGANSLVLGAGNLVVGNKVTVGENSQIDLNGKSITVGDGTPETTADTMRIYAGGTLGGTGTILGDVVNDGGTVGPGFSPGALTIDGNYTQTAGSVLNIEVAGLGAGLFDTLTILGDATFEVGSTINFDFIDGFEPALGDTFDFFSAALVSADPGALNFTFSGLESGFLFDTSLNADTFNFMALSDGVSTTSVSAVPVPAAVWLFGSGLLGLIGVARRK